MTRPTHAGLRLFASPTAWNRTLGTFLIAAALPFASCSKTTPQSESTTSAVSESNPSQASQPSEKQDAATPPEKLTAKHLPNPYRLHPQVISGGLPEGDAAFQELKDLGVKTVISVDGMKPDVEIARKYGMRYVHLPHSYDGVPENREKELAKAVRDLPGPIYIHCHHGKHRSPTASAVACVGAGLIGPDSALLVLETAGTSKNYRGLYDAAREIRAFDKELLDNLAADFPEVSAIPPMAEAMVALEHTHAQVKQIAEAGWKSPPAHPDLDPAHEALLLREHYTEMLRLDSVAQHPEDFRKMLTDSEAAAQQLEDALHKSPVDEEAAKQSLEAVNQACAACHRTYRDNSHP